jgi:hypothetical protein
VLESLAQGVPQVAIPVTYDQPGVAARIADKKTGVVTSLDKLTAYHLSTLLDEVLNDPTYRDNARKLRTAIAKTNGLSVAADLLEESLGVTKKGRQAIRRSDRMTARQAELSSGTTLSKTPFCVTWFYSTLSYTTLLASARAQTGTIVPANEAEAHVGECAKASPNLNPAGCMYAFRVTS